MDKKALEERRRRKEGEGWLVIQSRKASENKPRYRQSYEGSGKHRERKGEESYGTCRVKGREAGLEQGWARLGCSWSQLGQRLFIWFLINQRKCLDQMGPLLLDCLPRVGPPRLGRGVFNQGLVFRTG